jgi:hypothetical protein
MVSTVAQVMKERADSSRVTDASTAPDHVSQHGGGDAPDWRALAERRLARLVEAEHDASVSRDRLDLVQSECRELLALSVNRLMRIQALERDIATMRASRSWRWTAVLRSLSARLASAKGLAVRAARKAVKLPVVRPIVKMSVRLLPGLSVKLHAKLHAQKH